METYGEADLNYVCSIAMKRIKLTGKRGGYALVDSDKAWLNKYKWNHRSTGYVAHQKQYKGKVLTIMLHHVIIGRPLVGQIDHINGNLFDNRRSNLRFCSARDNNTNRTKPHPKVNYGRNVYLTANVAKPYRVICTENRRKVNGGVFATIKEARKAAKKLREKLGYACI